MRLQRPLKLSQAIFLLAFSIGAGVVRIRPGYLDASIPRVIGTGFVFWGSR